MAIAARRPITARTAMSSIGEMSFALSFLNADRICRLLAGEVSLE